jgi:protein TIF31
LIRDASDFLLTTQIPAFIRDCLDHTSVPMDGQTLSDNLHNRGINIRYIGAIANMLSKVPQLRYIHSITVSEVIVRYVYSLF